jgi:hypothetical protein
MGFPNINSQRKSKTNKGKTRSKRTEKGEEWKGEETEKNNSAPHYFYIQF